MERIKTLSFRGAKTLGKKLDAHRDEAFLSHKLATIKTDCELPVGLGDLDIAHPDREALTELYREMEFKAWLSDLLEGKDEGVNAAPAGESDAADEPEEESDKGPSTPWLFASFVALMLVMGACTVVFEPASKAGLGLSG